MYGFWEDVQAHRISTRETVSLLNVFSQDMGDGYVDYRPYPLDNLTFAFPLLLPNLSSIVQPVYGTDAFQAHLIMELSRTTDDP
jgi:hypothetical protein